MLFVLFSTIFSSTYDDPFSKAHGMTAGRFFLPAMIAAGVLLTSFQTTAMEVATERDDGTLKRLRGTPMPPAAYFVGKIGLVLVTSILQVIVLLALARFGYGVPLPDDAAHWLTFAWVFVLGIIGGVTLGIAYSSIASARSVGATVIAPVLILQFISGVYLDFSMIPGWMQQIAAIFPLKWIAQGMRSAFFPEAYAAHEMAGSWTALILAAWALAGLVLCLKTFRWYKRGTT
ncbi:MAG: ABC transporter permease [Nostocoides sp.]